jgi:2-keto-4-pentenoate hydratase/2-oxohepta-3-ene-1,7-dioic acid hydratase in catechol pathway
MKNIKSEENIIFPTKVVCVGRNYLKHIEELKNQKPKEPVFFIKPNSSITTSLYYFEDTRYEGELAFLVKDGKLKSVGFGLDLTKAELQNRLKAKGLPWEKAKAFDNSCVLSSFVKIKEWENFSFELFINGKLVQKGDVEKMIYKPHFLLKEAKKFFSFENGDILMCGTPSGVGYYKRGDKFEAKLFANKKEYYFKWKVI